MLPVISIIGKIFQTFQSFPVNFFQSWYILPVMVIISMEAISSYGTYFHFYQSFPVNSFQYWCILTGNHFQFWCILPVMVYTSSSGSYLQEVCTSFGVYFQFWKFLDGRNWKTWYILTGNDWKNWCILPVQTAFYRKYLPRLVIHGKKLKRKISSENFTKIGNKWKNWKKKFLKNFRKRLDVSL